jgi:hypothetical protein
MQRRIALALALSAHMLSLAACDDKPKDGTKEKEKGAPSATASAAPSAAPSAEPPEPTATTLSMDDVALTVNADKVPFEGPDAKGRLALALAGKPKIAGETVALVVMRAAKAPKVTLVAAALKDQKAKGLVLKAQTRDGKMSEIPVTFGVSAPCVAVAAIGKDVAINVWTLGGTTAKRFAKGMAGPDLTLGSEGLRKQASACDTKVAVLGADESVTFGLVFDLALAAKDGPADPKLAGLTFGLAEGLVAGRKASAL